MEQVRLLVLALAGVLVARATSLLVAGGLAGPIVPLEVDAARDVEPAPRDTRAFLDRNPFRAAREDLERRPPPSPDRCTRSPMGVVLVGTTVGARGAVATFSGDDSYQIGERVRGEALVRAIDPGRVVVERDGRCEVLAFDDAPAAPPMELPRWRVAEAGPGEYEIPRAEVERILGSLDRLAVEGVRVVPAFRAGKSVGFKLFSVRPGSLPATLGLRSGDILQAVNGHRLDGPSSSLEAWSQLKEADTLTAGIDRGGRPVTLRYTIR